MGKPKLTTEDVARAVDLYASGSSIRQVGLILGCSYGVARGSLLRAGVQLRPGGDLGCRSIADILAHAIESGLPDVLVDVTASTEAEIHRAKVLIDALRHLVTVTLFDQTSPPRPGTISGVLNERQRGLIVVVKRTAATSRQLGGRLVTRRERLGVETSTTAA